jgi:hypothetical protein
MCHFNDSVQALQTPLAFRSHVSFALQCTVPHLGGHRTAVLLPGLQDPSNSKS